MNTKVKIVPTPVAVILMLIASPFWKGLVKSLVSEGPAGAGQTPKLRMVTKR